MKYVILCRAGNPDTLTFYESKSWQDFTQFIISFNKQNKSKYGRYITLVKVYLIPTSKDDFDSIGDYFNENTVYNHIRDGLLEQGFKDFEDKLSKDQIGVPEKTQKIVDAHFWEMT